MVDREYELKFLIDTRELGRLVAHPLVAGAQNPVSAKLVATYFDTPDRFLWGRGITLRVRDADGRKTQTLKQKGVSFIDRGEWEFDIDTPAPVLGLLCQTPLRRYFRRHRVADALAPSFTVCVQRTTFTLHKGLSEIEVALDRGMVEADGKTGPVDELELELKRGEPADLFELGRELVMTAPLTPSLISKAERGYALTDGPEGKTASTPKPLVSPDMPVKAAFQALAEACLHDFMVSAGALSSRIDVEAVHKSRVALRRLRAAMMLFKPRIDGDGLAALRPELKWMSDLLGAARDLDVFQTEVFDPAAERDRVLGAEMLAAVMRAKQRQAHEALTEGVRSQRWRMALHELIAWMTTGAWLDAPAGAEPLRDFAVDRLAKRRKSVLKQGARLAELAPVERHHVRIQAKKLRYGLEFFAHVSGLGKGSRTYRKLVEALEDLQSSLGRLHDDEAKSDMLRAEVTSSDLRGAPEAAFAAGILADASADFDRLIEAAEHAYRRVKKHDPF